MWVAEADHLRDMYCLGSRKINQRLLNVVITSATMEYDPFASASLTWTQFFSQGESLLAVASMVLVFDNPGAPMLLVASLHTGFQVYGHMCISTEGNSKSRYILESSVSALSGTFNGLPRHIFVPWNQNYWCKVWYQPFIRQRNLMPLAG